ncbi:MAG: hypothetical protein ACREE2_04660 [Stellaceae bacterium]
MTSRFFWVLAAAMFALLAASAAVIAADPGSTTPAAPASGIWTVQGRELPGRGCGHWLVRLTKRNGALSGVVSLARSSVPIENLALRPDGSFSGATRAGVSGSTYARPYKVTGKFSGNTVYVTLETNRCPLRHGAAIRHAGG